MSEHSVGGQPPKTAPGTPAAASSGGADEDAAPVEAPVEVPKSPMDEDDIEEADIEEDEPSSDEDEDGNASAAMSMWNFDCNF